MSSDCARYIVIVLSAVTYLYASLTILRHKPGIDRVATGVIAVYAFSNGVEQFTVLGQPGSVRTLLAVISAIVAALWFVGLALRDRCRTASTRRGRRAA